MLQLIFFSSDNRYPTIEELVLCDLFRNIDLRELRGPSVSVCIFIHSKLISRHKNDSKFLFLLRRIVI